MYKNKSIRIKFYFFSIDWKVDGDPEHEISGPNPRVAEGALTMVFYLQKKRYNLFQLCFRLKQKSIKYISILKNVLIIKHIIGYVKPQVVRVLKTYKSVCKYGP